MDVHHGPITRGGMNPVVGRYGFVDPSLKGCTFTLEPSPDGIPGGLVTTHNCETLLPQLIQLSRWEPDGEGGFWMKGSAAVIARQWDRREKLSLMIMLPRNKKLGLPIRRLDAPNVRRPARLAAGSWSFFYTARMEPAPNPRLALLMNHRIDDNGRSTTTFLERFLGGTWQADEESLTLWPNQHFHSIFMMRFFGSGRTLTNANKDLSIVHD